MDPAHLVKLLISGSILLLVMSLGMRATFADATSLLRHAFEKPHRLLRALVAMYVVVPTFAMAMSLSFDLATPVQVGLLAMAIAPIPPILPGKQMKTGSSPGQVFGLLVAVSLCSVLLVPLMVEVLERVFGRESSFGPAQVARTIALTILIPLGAGLLLRAVWPRAAAVLAPWASRLGTLMLAAGVIAVLVKAWPAMHTLIVQGEPVAVMAVLGCLAIAAGHGLGGPAPSDRADLAIASAMRHPGIAIAVATSNAPEEPLLAAAILLYVLVAAVLTSVYVALVTRRRATPG